MVTMLIGAAVLSCCLIVVGEAGLLAPARRGSRDAWPAAWKQVMDHNTSGTRATRETVSSGGNGSHYDNETDTDGEEHHEIERYKVAVFDFNYVRTNLMIAIWVLFASIAKIGKLRNSQIAIYASVCERL